MAEPIGTYGLSDHGRRRVVRVQLAIQSEVRLGLTRCRCRRVEGGSALSKNVCDKRGRSASSVSSDVADQR
jgi:hypothetical protein